MKRRSALGLLCTAGIAGLGGCFGQSSGDARTTPTPLSGTFSTGEPTYWHQTLTGSGSLAAAESLFVLSEQTEDAEENRFRSTLTRFAPDGSEGWSQAINAKTGDLRATSDTVYLFRSGEYPTIPSRVRATEPTTGDILWDQPVSTHPTFVGATDDAVFVGATSDDPSRGPIEALDAASGDSLWQTETPMPTDGVVSHGMCLVEGHPDTVIALDTATGEKQWQKTPGRLEQTVVIGNTLVAFSEDGTTAYSLPGGDRRWHMADRAECFAVSEGSSQQGVTLYLGGRDGTVSAIDPETGAVSWDTAFDTETSRGVRGIAHGGDTVVVRMWDTVSGLSTAGGTEQWRQVLTPVERMADPVIIDQTVFVIHASTEDEFTVKTFDLDSGRKQWRLQRNRADNLLPEAIVYAGQFIVAPIGGVYGFSP
jgi:outer membrane protein assembly factor BamB